MPPITAWRVIRRHFVILVAIAAQRDVVIGFSARFANALCLGGIEIVFAAPTVMLVVFGMLLVLLAIPAALCTASAPTIVFIVIMGNRRRGWSRYNYGGGSLSGVAVRRVRARVRGLPAADIAATVPVALDARWRQVIGFIGKSWRNRGSRCQHQCGSRECGRAFHHVFPSISLAPNLDRASGLG